MDGPPRSRKRYDSPSLLLPFVLESGGCTFKSAMNVDLSASPVQEASRHAAGVDSLQMSMSGLYGCPAVLLL